MTHRDGLVLLVEDNGDDVLLTRRAFRKVGIDCPIEVVGDGEAALAYLGGTGPYADRDRHPLPSLVLLDLKLPRKSGFEVLEWRRDQPPAVRRVPVVVLTTSRESVDVRRAYDAGANSFLAKPVSPDDTQEMIRALGLYWLRMNERP